MCGYYKYYQIYQERSLRHFKPNGNVYFKVISHIKAYNSSKLANLFTLLNTIFPTQLSNVIESLLSCIMKESSVLRTHLAMDFASWVVYKSNETSK
jgi:hypothetical protein